MQRYAVVEDLQGGGFGMGRCYTAKEWLDQSVEWRDNDDSWGEYGAGVDMYGENHNDDREWYIRFWNKAIADGKEQELINYISDVWSIDIQPAEKALEILKADKEKWGSSEEEDETIKEIENKLGVKQ